MNTLLRWARHLWLDATNARKLITPAGLTRLAQAVHASESRHRGELRLCVEGGLSPRALWQGQTPRQRAIELFSHLRVWDTQGNNGVLIYLLLAERRIEILADRGLSSQVSDAVWQDMAQRLSQALRDGQFEAGLQMAVEQVGALMRTHCPMTGDLPNPNELPDTVVLI
jgi:uncharacterized membrane protein